MFLEDIVEFVSLVTHLLMWAITMFYVIRKDRNK